jgi:seryl-tRNA synthetase
VAKAPLPLTRAERAKKRHFVGLLIFWAVLVPITVGVLFLASLHFGRDTRLEGEIIPPPNMMLNNEMWIVTDFSSLATGIADDLAKERVPLLQEIQERQDHVQRAQADVAAREERIRLIQEDIQASKDEIASVVKQSRDATQQIWDGEGAQIDEEYESHFNQLKQAIADRAKSLNLKYEPDPTYQSPEVWANAYRLALYEVPAGVDSVKEHQWLGDQMKQWRDFEKSLDDRKEQLREQAAQIKLAPAPKIADLNTKIEDLQQRIDGTEAEEVPLKAELQQAQADLATSQAEEAGLDDKYYKQLDSLPQEAITKHIPLATNGRFTWVDDDVFAEGEKEHHYWIFARATRADGRQYWALHPFSIGINQTLELYIEPTGFISTKTILRPDLSPDEQEQ